MVFISCLHLKLSHRQKYKSSRSASSCDHCLPEGDHAQQGVGQLWNWQYQAKEEAMIQRGQVVALLVYKKREQLLHLKVLKCLYLL